MAGRRERRRRLSAERVPVLPEVHRHMNSNQTDSALYDDCSPSSSSSTVRPAASDALHGRRRRLQSTSYHQHQF